MRWVSSDLQRRRFSPVPPGGRAVHDAADGVDRAHELAFERALLIDLLNRARGAQGRLIKHFVSDDTRLGKTGS